MVHVDNKLAVGVKGSADQSKSHKYLVKPSRLQGVVRVSGAKNSALKLLAASLLTPERIFIRNYPDGLLDTQVEAGMLCALGKTCEISKGEINITETSPISSALVWEDRSIRTTLLILGALVTRTGSASVPLPGGCQLGQRGVDIHELVLRSMGADIWVEDGNLCAHVNGRLRGADIHLPLRSTGATENGIICGSLAEGVTRIWNPHIRPEIIDLIKFLRSMGAQIKVFGQEHIEITGVDALSGTQYSVLPDNMEAITWLVGSVITNGDIEIVDFPYDDLEVPLIYMRESGAKFYRGSNSLIVRGGRCYPVEISTGPYPGINSDMQPIFAVYGACAYGESKIVDLRFPDRYGYADELIKMGTDAHVEGNLLKIKGCGKLCGAEVRALDLRAGVALTLAGFVADGETLVQDAWQVERGYDDFVAKLRILGGDIRYA